MRRTLVILWSATVAVSASARDSFESYRQTQLTRQAEVDGIIQKYAANGELGAFPDLLEDVARLQERIVAVYKASANPTALDGQGQSVDDLYAEFAPRFARSWPSPQVPQAELAALTAHYSSLIRVGTEFISRDSGVQDNDSLMESIWLDDALPPGSRARWSRIQFLWPWAEKADEYPVFRGERATRIGSHTLAQATCREVELTTVDADDRLFVHINIDPRRPPEAVMLQICSTNWEHRAYWGSDAIRFGRDSEALSAYLPMGALPKTGEWVRLEIYADEIGLRGGQTITGVAFTQYGGLAYWDAFGISRDGKERLFLDDDLPEGSRSVTRGISPWQLVRGLRHPVHSGEHSVRAAAGSLERRRIDALPSTRSPVKELFAHVWLDPQTSPSGVMLEAWTIHNTVHRAGWGVQLSPPHGHASLHGQVQKGRLPPAGSWVRLSVAAEDIGLTDEVDIATISLVQNKGIVYWDRIGAATDDGDEVLWFDDDIPPGTKPKIEHDDIQFVPTESHTGQRSIVRSTSDLGQTVIEHEVLINEGDQLFAHVLISPDDPATALMLQFRRRIILGAQGLLGS